MRDHIDCSEGRVSRGFDTHRRDILGSGACEPDLGLLAPLDGQWERRGRAGEVTDPESVEEIGPTAVRGVADLDEHLAKIVARGYERRASYEVAGVVNMSFPILNVQGQAIAGLTVPFVKRLEDNISLTEIVTALREASREISEAMGAPLAAKKVAAHKKTVAAKE